MTLPYLLCLCRCDLGAIFLDFFKCLKPNLSSSMWAMRLEFHMFGAPRRYIRNWFRVFGLSEQCQVHWMSSKIRALLRFVKSFECMCDLGRSMMKYQTKNEKQSTCCKFDQLVEIYLSFAASHDRPCSIVTVVTSIVAVPLTWSHTKRRWLIFCAFPATLMSKVTKHVQ